MEEGKKDILEEVETPIEEVNDVNNDEVIIEDVIDGDVTQEEGNEVADEEEVEDEINMLRKSKDEVKKLNNEIEALKDRLLRITAEYENYRKRTTKEKEGIYTDACTDVIKEILPVVDNLERAIAADGNVEDLKKGIEMTIKGLQGSFDKLGVEEIDASAEFDPNLHQAVMHIEDESFEKNSVVEVFMKGYKRGDKVIRYSVVKVAN
ncbi:nucleotide exchange factor GrpE [Clostridium paraputrificum]|uniref:nucleotide exchange factor GrpE n=1 Tax=Clostridium TaxID=1485 RepID=UPI003D34147B